MSKNNTATAAARKLAFNRIASAAFAAGTSMIALRRVLADAGIKPVSDTASRAVKEGQYAIRRQFIYGYMAVRLDGQTEADRIEYARALVEDYAGWINPADYAKGGKNAGKDMPKLPKGAKGRRTQEEEKAYTAARVALTRMLNDMGIVTLSKQGGNRKKAGAQPAGTKPNDNKPNETKTPSVKELREAAPKFKDGLELYAYFVRQASAWQTTLNKNSQVTCNSRLGELINKLHSDLLSLGDEFKG